jgi:predicted acylesterase/phospholipase RssA
MIHDVAREAEKGRLLLVATTDVATGEPVVWDLGSIARNGSTHARALFRDVLLASTSVPAVFPPVKIRIRDDQATHEEVHVDGNATLPFFVPLLAAQRTPGAENDSRRATVFVIVDGPLGRPTGEARLTTQAILSSSIHAGLDQMLLTRLELTAATAELEAVPLRYSALPSMYPETDSFDFRASSLRPLFHYAYECARQGRLWTAFGHTEVGGSAKAQPAKTQSVPCPADDAFIGYFARR